MPPTDSRALELTANIQVAGSTVYVLNDRRIPSNLWSAQVQPGFDGNDRRLSVAECEVIAEKIASALSAAPQSDGWRPTTEAPFGEDVRALLVDGSVLVDAVRQIDGDWEWRNRFFPNEIIEGWLPAAQTEGASHGE